VAQANFQGESLNQVSRCVLLQFLAARDTLPLFLLLIESRLDVSDLLLGYLLDLFPRETAQAVSLVRRRIHEVVHDLGVLHFLEQVTRELGLLFSGNGLVELLLLAFNAFLDVVRDDDVHLLPLKGLFLLSLEHLQVVQRLDFLLLGLQLHEGLFEGLLERFAQLVGGQNVAQLLLYLRVLLDLLEQFVALERGLVEIEGVHWVWQTLGLCCLFWLVGVSELVEGVVSFRLICVISFFVRQVGSRSFLEDRSCDLLDNCLALPLAVESLVVQRVNALKEDK